MQDPTNIEVDIIVEIVVFKKLKSVSEERGKNIQRMSSNFCCFFEKERT